MDTVTDATRISSNNHEVIEESSPPEVTLVLLTRPNRRIKNQNMKLVRELNLPSSYERVHLSILFIATNMINRQTAGNIVNRSKGKISQSEYGTNALCLHLKESTFYSDLNRLLAENEYELLAPSMSASMISRIIDLLSTLSLKELSEKQKTKLHDKFTKMISRQGIHFTNDDTVSNLTRHLMGLSPDERERVWTLLQVQTP